MRQGHCALDWRQRIPIDNEQASHQNGRDRNACIDPAAAAPAQGFDTPLVENPDALARLFLAEGGNAWIGGDLEIFGTNGAEQLTVLFGEASLGPSFNIGNDLLFLEQPGGDFTAARSGSRALFDSATTDLSVPVGEAGMAVTFANATATLAYDPMADAILIGTQTIDTTPMPLTFA